METERIQNDDNGRIYPVILIFIILLSLCTDLFFFTGLLGSDDTGYIGAAYDVVNGLTTDYRATNTFAARRSAVVLPAALFALSSSNAQGISAGFISFHLLLIALVYLLGSHVHNRRVGLMAAGLTAICPLVVVYAGSPLPDIPGTAFMVAALLFAFVARQSSRYKYYLYFTLSGLMIGLAYSAKESGLLFIPVIMLVAVFPYKNGSLVRKSLSVGCLFLGIAAIVVFEFFFIKWMFGKSEFRVMSLAALVQNREALSYGQIIDMSLSRLHIFLGLMSKELGWFAPLFLCSVIVYPFFKNRSWVVWISVVWWTAYHLWGSVSPFRYVPNSIQSRYFTLIVPFSAICVAYLGDHALHAIQRWIPFQPLRRSLQAALAFGGVMLLLNSAGLIDKYSGNVYQADTVAGTTKAMEFAMSNYKEPVVIAALTSFRCTALFFKKTGESSPKRIITTNFIGMPSDQASQLLAGGGCLYILSNSELVHSQPDWLKNVRVPKDRFDLDREVKLALNGKSTLINARRIGAFFAYPRRSQVVRLDNWLGFWREARLDRMVFLYHLTAQRNPPVLTQS